MSDEAMALRRYLLGDLPEDERERVELGLLEGGDAMSELAAAEDGLIEDYLAEALSPAERGHFEQHFLASPDHARTVLAARWLREQVSATLDVPARRSRGLAATAWLAAAAAVAIALGGLWLSQERRAPRTTSTIARPAATEAPPEARVATLTLSAGRVMAAGAPVPHAIVTRDTARLRLELIVEDPELDRCRVSIADPQGHPLWHADGVRAARLSGGAVVTVEIAMDELPAASLYKATLTAEPSGASVGTYDFWLLRK